MSTHHHKVPVDFSRRGEPIYLGLDAPRAAALAALVFLTLWAASWNDTALRTACLIPAWSAFIALGFLEVSGWPLASVASWYLGWLGRRLLPKPSPRSLRVFQP